MTQAPQIADDIPQPVLLLDLKAGALLVKPFCSVLAW